MRYINHARFSYLLTLVVVVMELLQYIIISDSYTACMCVCMSIVSKVPLNVACDPDDECLDASAQCLNNICRCLSDFYDQNGRCGTLPRHS